MAHPQLLLAYGGRATLAQAFSLVERLDQGLCVEEAGRLSSVMTGVLILIPLVVEANQGQGTSW